MLFITWILIILSYIDSAYSNDTISSIDGGRLIFEKTNEISMESEDLEISPTKVKVQYTFLNQTDKPIQGIVAFPISEFTDGLSPLDMPGNEENPLNFELSVDGKKTPFKTKYDKSGEADVAFTYSNFTIYWEQVFPPKVPVKVDHSYTPSFQSAFPDEKEVCADDNFKAALKRIMASIDKRLNATQKEKDEGKRADVVMHYDGFKNLHYILKTARNWKGPIKHFHLTVDKGKPDTIVSFCGDNVKKTSKTKFEVTYKNFVPTKDLFITFMDEPK